MRFTRKVSAEIKRRRAAAHKRKAIADLIKGFYRRGKWPASNSWAQRITEVVTALNKAHHHRGLADDLWSSLDTSQRLLRAERERLLQSQPAFTPPLYQPVDDAEKAVTSLKDHPLAGRARRPGRPPADWDYELFALEDALRWSLTAAGRKASFTSRAGPGIKTLSALFNLKRVGEDRKTEAAVWHALRRRPVA